MTASDSPFVPVHADRNYIDNMHTKRCIPVQYVVLSGIWHLH